MQCASTHRRRLAAPRAPLHCGVLAEGRYLAQAQPRGPMNALAAHGHRVKLIDSGAGALEVDDGRWLEGLDLVIARGRSPELLARLALAEGAGVPTPTRRHSIASVLDKAHMAASLAASPELYAIAITRRPEARARGAVAEGMPSPTQLAGATRTCPSTP